MALKAILDSVDGLSDDLKKEYTLVDTDGPLKGKYQLAVESVEGFALENVTGLKNSLEATRGERDAAADKLKAYGDITPNQAKEGKTALNKLSTLDPEKDAEKIAETKIEAIKTQMKTEHDKEIGTLKGDNSKLKQQVEKILIDATAESAIVKAGGDPLLLMPAVKQSMKLKENDDGSFTVQVVSKEGNPRIKDSAGNPMGVDDLVGELKSHESYSKAFAPVGTGGPGGGKNPPPAGTKRSTMSIEQKVEYIGKHGEEAFQALPD